MEITTLFTEQKWNILKILSNHEASPLQLAESSSTTIANISQQLRLLEAAELVKKHKIKNREKGKPRTLFSLSNDYAYLVSTMQHFADKKLLVLNDYHKFILRVLYLTNTELHYYLSKYYWKIEDILPQIDAMVLSQEGNDDIQLLVISDKGKEIQKKVQSTVIKKPGSGQKTVSLQGVNKDELKRIVQQRKSPFDKETIQIVYDPDGLISSLTRKKEGDN